MTMTYDQFTAIDDHQAHLDSLEEQLADTQERFDDASEILWAIAEKVAPELLEGLGDSRPQLVQKLISEGSDGAAELLLESVMFCHN